MAWTDPESYTLDQLVGVTEMHKIRDNMRELWHEIAYVEFTADVSTAAATEAAPLDVVSSGAITYVANPIMIEFWTPGVTINGTGGINLWDASTDLGRWDHAISAAGHALHLLRRLTPTAASHTYKVRLWTTGGATNTIRGGAGGAGVNVPGFIRILQKGGT
jgi:hypothetical protein